MKLIPLDTAPPGWTHCRLNEVVTSYSGNSKLIKGQQHPEPGPEYFPGFSASGQDVWLDTYEEEGPAVILSAVGARCGKCFLANGKWSAIANTHVLKCRPDALAPRFLWYLVNDENFWIRGGTGQPFVRTKSSLEREFCLPPLEEQGRIVAKIEELFSELEKGVESLTTAREQLKAYRQSVLKHAFEGRLTRPSGTANSWQERRLGDFIEFLTSGSRGWADYYSDYGDLFIRAQNLKHDRLELSDVAFVRLPEGKTEGVRTRVRLGDVLVTITGANVTKTGLVDQELGTAYVSQHVALCRPTENLHPEFLYWYLLSEAGGRRQLNDAAYGAGKPGLNLENIRSVSIPVPSLAEQRAVVSLIVTVLESEERINDDVSAALERVEALRQSILKRAFSGQLVAQDAADEPASALLERIRVGQKEGGSKQRPNHKNGKKEAA